MASPKWRKIGEPQLEKHRGPISRLGGRMRSVLLCSADKCRLPVALFVDCLGKAREEWNSTPLREWMRTNVAIETPPKPENPPCHDCPMSGPWRAVRGKFSCSVQLVGASVSNPQSKSAPNRGRVCWSRALCVVWTVHSGCTWSRLKLQSQCQQSL